jgi:hypothetical protein
MSAKTCANCACWVPLLDDDQEVNKAGPAIGECREDSPKLDPDGTRANSGGIFGIWPVTLPTDSCRKHVAIVEG